MIYYKNNTLTASPTIANILNPTQEQILDAGWFIYIDTPSTYDQATQKLIKTDIIDGVQGYEVVELTHEEIREMTVPDRIKTFQGKLLLLRLNLLATIEAMINAAGEEEKIYWEYATEWERTSPIINRLAPSIGWGDSEVDQFFIEANKLN